MSNKLDGLALFLLVLGGIAWGVVGLYDKNVIEYIFNREWLIRVVYVIFGFAFVYHTVTWRIDTKKKKRAKR